MEVDYVSFREVAGDVNDITFNFAYTDEPCSKKAKTYEKALTSCWTST